jgi:hypothetical protein
VLLPRQNLAVLTLLQERRRFIVCMDGGEDGDYTNSCILDLLNRARELLGCSFAPYTVVTDDAKKRSVVLGYDVENHIRRRFAKAPTPAARRFVVLAVWYSGRTQRTLVTHPDGVLVILKPREPSFAFIPAPLVSTVPQGDEAAGFFRESRYDADVDVVRATERPAMCCDTGLTQHSLLCRYTVGNFPHTHTWNQFFTPRLQAEYHGEGFRCARDAFWQLCVWSGLPVDEHTLPKLCSGYHLSPSPTQVTTEV